MQVVTDAIASWGATRPELTGHFQRDADAHSAFWHKGYDLLAQSLLVGSLRQLLGLRCRTRQRETQKRQQDQDAEKNDPARGSG